uniref:WW domain-containing protein n=1 Tax=Globisporangium ultimum (strain ATCC 200006 / CBS 805.95 / DAOM BR144) TaxID=431595 RepID=K3WDA0_GLOUD
MSSSTAAVSPFAQSERMAATRTASCGGDDADTQQQHAALVARGRALLENYRERRLHYESDQELRAHSAVVNGEPHESGVVVKTQQLLSTSVSENNNSGGGGVADKEISSWSELVHVQLQNTLLLDAMETRVQDLYSSLLPGKEQDPAQRDSHFASTCDALSQLVQQKRVVEDAMVSFTAAMGPPLVLDSDTDESGDEEQPVPMVNAEKIKATGKKSHKWISQQQLRDLVDVKTEALQREVDESKMFIADLKAKVHAYKSESVQSNGKSRSVFADSITDEPPVVAAATEKEPNNDAYHEYYVAGAEREIRKLQSALLEKEELLISLRTSLEHVMLDHGRLEQELKRSCVAIDQLSAEHNHIQKAAADAKALLNRAYSVKARQLDQLCSNIDLPTQWQQVTDAKNGIVYFQQRGHAPQLEDPRVLLAVRQYNIGRKVPSASSSPRSSSGQSEAQDRRSSSGSRHESVDLSTTACEDIPEPPDDGCKHQIDDFATPLPEGWEMRATAAGSVFFVNRQTNVTTWNDPRETLGGGQSKAPGSLRRVKIPFAERKQGHGGHENTVTSYRPPSSDILSEEDGVQYFDVVFKERGPIGIHFQANSPDAGATVRRLLPGTAAINTGILRPFDRLIAVNHNPVDTASFRHVMILLQGGLRPLTLTFKRELQQQRGERSSSTSAQGGRTQSASMDADLDEEVVLDADADEHETPDHSSQRRRSSRDFLHRRSSAQDVTNQRESAPSRASSSASHDGDADGDSVADKIITNLFSFFWTPPEPLTGEVQTV